MAIPILKSMYSTPRNISAALSLFLSPFLSGTVRPRVKWATRIFFGMNRTWTKYMGQSTHHTGTFTQMLCRNQHVSCSAQCSRRSARDRAIDRAKPLDGWPADFLLLAACRQRFVAIRTVWRFCVRAQRLRVLAIRRTRCWRCKCGVFTANRPSKSVRNTPNRSSMFDLRGWLCLDTYAVIEFPWDARGQRFVHRRRWPLVVVVFFIYIHYVQLFRLTLKMAIMCICIQTQTPN